MQTLSVLGSCSFCRGHSKGSDFTSSLARGAEGDGNICAPRIDISPAAVLNQDMEAALWMQSQQAFAAMGAHDAYSHGGQKRWCWPICAGLCLPVSKMKMVLPSRGGGQAGGSFGGPEISVVAPEVLRDCTGGVLAPGLLPYPLWYSLMQSLAILSSQQFPPAHSWEGGPESRGVKASHSFCVLAPCFPAVRAGAVHGNLG